jgi:hypothetical protein
MASKANRSRVRRRRSLLSGENLRMFAVANSKRMANRMMTRRLIPRAYAGRSRPTAEARSKRRPIRFQGNFPRLQSWPVDGSGLFQFLQAKYFRRRFFFPFPVI